MVNTTESSTNHHSPPMTAVPPAESDSPKFPRKNLPSPWAQVVRGAEPESTAGTPQSPAAPPPPASASSSSSPLTASVASVPDQLPSSDSSSPKAVAASPPVDNRSVVTAPPDSSDGGEGNAGRSKKPAWNKPSNGVVSEAGPVMGGSWPALSESTKGTPKLAAESSSKTALDASLSTSQGPVTSNTPQRQATSHAKPNSATTYNIPNRQRPMKRGGGSSIGSGPSSSGFPNVAPPPPPFPVYQVPAPAVGYGNVMPGAPDHSPRDHYRRNTWDARPPVGSFVPPMTEHRGSSRRGNFGSHPRGDGSYHSNYGSRRDHDRANYGNARDAHVHQPGGILRHPPPNASSFVNPAHVGPYANHMGFPGADLLYVSPVQVDPMRGMSFFPSSTPPPPPPPPPSIFFHAETSSPLNNMIIKQIEYYFSDANLVKDEYLRSNMDEQGWVPITLIANFPRVKNLTSNIQLILDSLRGSAIVEVQGDKLRRHNEWMRWLPATHLRSDSNSISTGGSKFNNLAANFQAITLEEAAKNEVGPVVTQIPNGDDDAVLNKN